MECWPFILLIYFLLHKEVHGQADLNCDMLSTYVANGTDVSLACTTPSPTLRWILPSGSFIDFGGGDAEGAMKMGDVFTATYVVRGRPANSSLNFTLTTSLNGTNVTCLDNSFVGVGVGSESCLILVTIFPPQIPLNPFIISSTYESALLQWSPPSFNGGSMITSYMISVIPSPRTDSTCPGGQCNTTKSKLCTLGTTALLFNVTGLTPNVNHQFNISAVNSAGEGKSASINGTPLGTVFPALTDPPQLCLNYSDNEELTLSITWKCSSIGNATTLPFTSYTVCINNNCSMVSNDSCSSMSLPVNCSDTYNVNVSVNNIVGSSDSSPTASINTDILQPSMVDMITNESVRINYTQFNACSGFPSSNINITILNTGSMDTRSVRYDTNGMITLDSLNANTAYMYSLSLVVDGNYACNGSILTNFMTSATVDNGGGTTPSSSPTASVTPSTTSALSLGATMGIAVGVALIILVVPIIIIVICWVLKKGYKSVGQPIYQEAMSSEDIQRKAAPTNGELCAQPSKASMRRPPPPQPQAELATYQDPSTIQRTQAPNTDYLYAEVDKKPQQQAVYAQVDEERVS